MNNGIEVSNPIISVAATVTQESQFWRKEESRKESCTKFSKLTLSTTIFESKKISSLEEWVRGARRENNGKKKRREKRWMHK